MFKYLLSDILQYVLNEYIDHWEIETYNLIFDIEFDTKKYIYEKIRDAEISEISGISEINEINVETFIDFKVSKVMNYKFNKSIGKYVKIRESNCKKNLKHGKELIWYAYGTKWFEVNYIDGDKNGVMIRWQKNGNVACISNWKNGYLDGIKWNFDSGGFLINKEYHDKGIGVELAITEKEYNSDVDYNLEFDSDE